MIRQQGDNPLNRFNGSRRDTGYSEGVLLSRLIRAQHDRTVVPGSFNAEGMQEDGGSVLDGDDGVLVS